MKMFLLKVVFVLWLSSIVSCEDVFVDIAQGRLQGLKRTTVRDQKQFYSFKGIPYVKPRVGKQKFQSPEPPDSWNGILDATEHRSHCPFLCFIRKKVVGSDDCLYLNVYTPDLNEAAGKPVIVFIHPGCYNSGSGNEDIYGADYLIDQDVILVTFNYRLTATGFLSTNDANAPGNNGHKDQVYALKWVRDNIEKFGGDPNKITLFGESGGAASAIYHMSSAMSKGLFHKAALLSGSTISSWAINYDPAEIAFRFGKELGIETRDTAVLMNKLSEIDAEKLVMASEAITKQENILNGRFYAFAPSIEPNIDGHEPFITNDVWELMKNGKISDIPIMIGSSRDQGSCIVPGIMMNDKLANAPYEDFIPQIANITDPAIREQVGDSIGKFYFDGAPVTSKTGENLDRIMTDVTFTQGPAISAKILSSQLTSPVYEYSFTFDGPYGFFKNFLNLNRGVMHTDVWFYIFYSKAANNLPAPGSDEEKVQNKFVKFLSNFAKEGNPTAKLDQDVNVEWLPVKNGKNVMTIDKELTMHDYVNRERMMFWVDVYKDVLGELYNLFK